MRILPSKFEVIVRNFQKGAKVLLNQYNDFSSYQPPLKNKSLQSSYFHNAEGCQLLGLTMGQLIDQSANRFGDRFAVIDCPQKIKKTFIQFKDDIYKLATGFLATGFQRGDRIGIWSPNRYEWILTQMAAIKAGLILVPINPLYQPSELNYCLNKLQIRAILTPEKFMVKDFYKAICTSIPEIVDAKPGQIKSKQHPYFDTLILFTEDHHHGAFNFNHIMNAGGSNEKMQLDKLQEEIQFDDPMNIIFTSGTTGSPKAAVHSHFGIINNCLDVNEKLGYNVQETRICCTVPLFHVFGCVGVNCSVITNGVCVVMPAAGYSPEASLNAIEEEKCTSIYGTPTMFIDMLNHPKFKNTNLSSLKGGIMAGAPCPSDLVRDVIHKFAGPGFGIGYGSTEIGVVSLHHYQEDPIEMKIENDGKILANLEVKIVDSNGAILPIGTPGEICVRGYTVSNIYWKDEENCKNVVEHNWFHTGDIGTLTSNGYLKIVGRSKDMIIRGGENIFPAEIEAFLLTHPKINEANIIGIPDKRMGEEVCAWIKLKDNEVLCEADVKEFFKGKISDFKIPRYVHFVNDFPRNSLGKALKYVMQEEMKTILKLG